jgi:hypothetical protein
LKNKEMPTINIAIMDIEKIISEIKNEYINLLDGNLERYIVEPAPESLINQVSLKFDISLPLDFVWFLTKSELKIAIENAYDTIEFKSVEYKLEKMNQWLDEGAFDGKIGNNYLLKHLKMN